MPDVFDTLPLDFSKAAVQQLWEILYSTIKDVPTIQKLAGSAAVKDGLVNYQQGSRGVWHEVLDAARNQDKLQALLDVVENDENFPATGKRVNALRGPNPGVEPQLPPAARKKLGSSGWHGLPEKRTGDRSTFHDVAFLATGMARASAVVLVRVWYQNNGAEAKGTGFLIAPDLVLTNHHVLYDKGVAAVQVEVWVGYQVGLDGSKPTYTAIAGKPETIAGEEQSDWAVIRLTSAPSGASVLSLDGSKPLHANEPVFIIQHPNGLPKQISLGHNEVRYVDDDVIQYLTDTDAGSSGAPVFNESWEVVGLHHMWQSADENGKIEIRNEGIRIERVREGLKAKSLLP